MRWLGTWQVQPNTTHSGKMQRLFTTDHDWNKYILDLFFSSFTFFFLVFFYPLFFPYLAVVNIALLARVVCVYVGEDSPCAYFLGWLLTFFYFFSSTGMWMGKRKPKRGKDCFKKQCRSFHYFKTTLYLSKLKKRTKKILLQTTSFHTPSLTFPFP